MITLITIMSSLPHTLYAQSIQWRGFFISPTLTTSLRYTDNLFSDATNQESELIYTLKPSLAVNKSYRSHDFSLSMNGTFKRHRDNASQNTDNIEINSENNIQVTRSMSIPLNLGFERQELRRSSPGNPRFTRKPLIETRYSFQSGLKYSFNRLNLDMLGRYSKTNFDDGVSRLTGDTINFSRNNRENFGVSASASYDIRPNHSLFTRLNFSRSSFEERENRDSKSYGISAGFNTNYKGLITGSASAGFFTQDFDADNREGTDRLDFSADLGLSVTPKLQLSFDAEREIVESTEFSQNIIRTDLGFGYDYELQHDVFTAGFVNFQTSDIPGNTREDDTYTFGLSLRYLHGRHFTSRFSYQHNTRNSVLGVNEFDKDTFIYSFTSKL